MKTARIIFDIFLGGFLAATATGCSANNFATYNTLGDLRVVTLVIDQPEANPGTTVNVTPVLSDLNGGGRTLSYAVEACIDPGVGVGVTPACAAPDPANTQTGTVSVAAGTSQTYTNAVSSFPVTLPGAATIFAGQDATAQFNGIAYLVFYVLSASDGTTVSSFVRVTVSEATKTPKNQDPTITSVNENDVPITGIFAMPAVATNFSVTFPETAAETYQVMTSNGALISAAEQLETTWFVSDGSFQFERTVPGSEDSWTPPSPKPASRGEVILVVTRDGRGGTVFQKIEMN